MRSSLSRSNAVIIIEIQEGGVDHGTGIVDLCAVGCSRGGDA